MYLKTETDNDGKEIIGNASCVTRFISSLILLMEHGAKAHLRHLSEFFGLLFEFSRMGDEETVFLLRIGVIKSVADFYLGNKTHDNVRHKVKLYFYKEKYKIYFVYDSLKWDPIMMTIPQMRLYR